MSYQVVAEVFRHSRASLGARLVLLALADSAGKDDGIVWLGQESLMRMGNLSERAVRDAIRWLEENGEIETRMAQRGRARINVYRITLGKYGSLDVGDLSALSNVPFTVRDPFSPPADIAARRLELLAIRMDAGLPGAVLEPPADSAASPVEDDRQSTTATTGSSDRDDRQFSAAHLKEGPSSDPSSDPAAARASARRPAAAADRKKLEDALAELGIELSAQDTIRALNDIDVALAWCGIAKREARTNPGGLVAAGLRGGTRPSRRLSAPGSNRSREERKADVVRALVRNLGAEDGPDEARHYIDRVWDDLTTIERAGLHELVDEIESELRFAGEEPIRDSDRAAS